MSNGPGTPPQLPALASQVWGCPLGPYAAPVLLWRHLKGRGFACLLPGSLPNCAAANLALWPVIKFSLTITHRLFQPKVTQRTDCRLMRVLSAS